MKSFAFALALGVAAMAAHAQNTDATRTGLCMVSASEQGTGATLMVHHNDCEQSDCGTSERSHIEWSTWSGISAQQLSLEGSALDAHLHADAGDIACRGSVHDGILAGRYTFTPNLNYQQQLKSLGLVEVAPERRMESYAMLDVSIAYIKQLQAEGVTGLDTHNILSLKALKVTPQYIHEMAAAGYPEHDAHKLQSMKAVGVTPEKVKEAKEMGFTPTQHELTQMAVFHIDRAFVDKMKARGMKDLTIAKLVKIKTFKLDE